MFSLSGVVFFLLALSSIHLPPLPPCQSQRRLGADGRTEFKSGSWDNGGLIQLYKPER